MKIAEKYMLRCIQIAQNGLGNTAPNPSVGAVIVYNNKIIGEGYTSTFGGNHAEVNAINSVKDKALLAFSTLYVTLEPCSHFGKTPPCSDLIISSKIPKVVIGLKDPNPLVSGKGIAKLKETGVEVLTAVLEAACRVHHKRFLSFQEKKRPYIILKWAQTSDGFVAPSGEMRSKDAQPYWITNRFSRQLVHRWRAEEQAILVGTNTVAMDNPSLTVRMWTGKSPIRVIIDKDLKIAKSNDVFDGYVPTIVFTQMKKTSSDHTNLTYIVLDFTKDVCRQIMNALYEKNVTSVIIEGGTHTLQSFIDVNLWDEARVFTGKNAFLDGVKAPLINKKPVAHKQIESDMLTYYRNE